ncbi:MAG: succinylglutamate desuccinylase/aspartoacylase family protein [Acidaminococcales bacterium]|jgi:hypothetical protein|nr:succinylglutamate desuccinylase/aspartoacylase family protein [Acidaminococcales bacterium]
MKKNQATAVVSLCLALAVLFMVAPAFREMNNKEKIRKGPGVSRIIPLSDYFDGLKNTAGDTEVYILDSGRPGGTVLVLGGTHCNEPAGYIGAILLLENAIPVEGRLIVIPRANASALTHTDYAEGSPQKISLQAKGGERWFRYGSRATNPVHQWPDPDIYIHAGSGQRLSGSETRNLNRAYPGRPDGSLTEKIAYAIVQLIKKEKADLSFDLHEASPEYPVINAMVAHERAMGIAAEAAMNLQLNGVQMGIEPSPQKLRGLSHREWGDATDTLAILMETANPAQGRLKGATGARAVMDGRDKAYEAAAKLGRLFIPFDAAGQPIDIRVARHIAAICESIAVYNKTYPAARVVLEDIPSYDVMVKEGIGRFL